MLKNYKVICGDICRSLFFTMGTAFIGTSGWNYKHWLGTFYPADLKPGGELGFYLLHFDTVEINNSFYKMPSRSLFEAWRKMTPDDFIFSVKAGRFLTHMKKLKDAKQPVERFFANVCGLGEKLGPILFQLPPRWNINIERFAEFLSVLPAGYRYAFEFRDGTWYNEQIYSLLKKYNCAFCVYELDGHRSPVITTADFIYVRLHGPGGKYQGSYPKSTLKKWSLRINKWLEKEIDVYVYFDNDDSGFAPKNALKLNSLVRTKK